MSRTVPLPLLYLVCLRSVSQGHHILTYVSTYIHTVYRYIPTALSFCSLWHWRWRQQISPKSRDIGHLDTVTAPKRRIVIVVQFYKLGCEKNVGLRKSLYHKRCIQCDVAGDPLSFDSWRDAIGLQRVQRVGRLCMSYWNSAWYIAWCGKAVLCRRQSGIASQGGEIHYLLTERSCRLPLCACM